LFQITEQISNGNNDLEREIEDLKQQKQQLEDMLERHSCKKQRNSDEPCEENKENNGDD
jgi:cell division protein FtsB